MLMTDTFDPKLDRRFTISGYHLYPMCSMCFSLKGPQSKSFNVVYEIAYPAVERLFSASDTLAKLYRDGPSVGIAQWDEVCDAFDALRPTLLGRWYQSYNSVDTRVYAQVDGSCFVSTSRYNGREEIVLYKGGVASVDLGIRFHTLVKNELEHIGEPLDRYDMVLSPFFMELLFDGVSTIDDV